MIISFILLLLPGVRVIRVSLQVYDWDLGLRDGGSGFQVQGLEFRLLGFGFRV